jgi:hypothetical protein
MDLQSAIALLLDFWHGGDSFKWPDIYDAIKVVASTRAEARQLVAAQQLWTAALIDEPMRQSEINRWREVGGLMPSIWSEVHSPRWYLLNGIKTMIQPSWFSTGDPTGVASWIGSVSAGGGAIEYTISADPDPEVRAEAIDLLLTSSFPIEWVPLLKSAVDKLDESLVSSAFDQQTRAVLAVLSRKLRARVYDVANRANAVDFAKLTLTLPDGSTASMPSPPPRPWYKRIELWLSGVGGVVGGAYAARKTSPNR